MLLCDDCRRSTKGRRSDAVFFGNEHTVRPVTGVNGIVNARTISTTAKISYHQHNGSQIQEKKSLLADNTPTPVIEIPMDGTKFVFPECFTEVI
jgi:hypothetical protein